MSAVSSRVHPGNLPTGNQEAQPAEDTEDQGVLSRIYSCLVYCCCCCCKGGNETRVQDYSPESRRASQIDDSERAATAPTLTRSSSASSNELAERAERVARALRPPFRAREEDSLDPELAQTTRRRATTSSFDPGPGIMIPATPPLIGGPPQQAVVRLQPATGAGAGSGAAGAVAASGAGIDSLEEIKRNLLHILFPNIDLDDSSDCMAVIEELLQLFDREGISFDHSFKTREALGTPGSFGAVFLAKTPGGNRSALKLLNMNKPSFADWATLEKGEVCGLLVDKGSEHIAYTQGLIVMDKETKRVFLVRNLDVLPIPKTQCQVIGAFTDYAEGARELFDVLNPEGAPSRRFSAEKAIQVGIGIALGLEKIHKSGVIYRDLKPENILLQPGFKIKIIDMGLSKPLKDSERTATFCGTPACLAPEQILNPRFYDKAVDIWALGAILSELVHGNHPGYSTSGKDLNISETADQILRFARLSRSKKAEYLQIPDDVPRAYQNIILDCFESDPRRRPTAAAVAEALGSLIKPSGAAAEEGS